MNLLQSLVSCLNNPHIFMAFKPRRERGIYQSFLDNLGGLVCGPIIQYQQLNIFICLFKNTAQTLFNVVLMVVTCYNNRY